MLAAGLLLRVGGIDGGRAGRRIDARLAAAELLDQQVGHHERVPPWHLDVGDRRIGPLGGRGAFQRAAHCLPCAAEAEFRAGLRGRRG